MSPEAFAQQWEVALMTMIYTQPQMEQLAEQAVEAAEKEAEQPLDEAEKERIWKLVQDACK